MKITRDSAQMINPASGGNPAAMESQEQVDNRFIANCKAKFPGIKSKTIDKVLKDLEDEALKLLKAEIQEDPEKRGYLQGKTSEQVAKLVSDPYLKKEPRKQAHPDPVKAEKGELVEVQVDIKQLPRICHVWQGVPNVPNTVTADDVKKALR